MDWISITMIVFVVLIFVFAFGAGYFFGRAKERNEPSDEVDKLGLPPCRCKDVNQCDTWCSAKERFKRFPPND